MTPYRCKHAVEAMRWTDTDDDRVRFCDWFDAHDALFLTVGPLVVLPSGRKVGVGEWLVIERGNRFLVMDDEQFRETYEEVR